MVTLPPDSYLLSQIKRSARIALAGLAVGSCFFGFLAFMALRDIQDGSQWLGLIWILLLLACLFGMYKTIDNSRNLEKHPLIKSLAAFGPVDQIVAKVEAEIKDPDLQTSTFILTKSWILGGMNIAFMPEIVWAHLKTLTQNFVVKNHSVIIYKRNGQFFETQGKENECHAVLEAISKKVPWAIVGYNTDLKKLWNSDKNSFIQQVDKRKKDAGTSL